MTEQEYANKSLCLVCAFGEATYKLANTLSIGIWDKKCSENLIIAHQLLKIFLKFDVRDLPDFKLIYNDISKSEMELLIIKLEKLL